MVGVSNTVITRRLLYFKSNFFFFTSLSAPPLSAPLPLLHMATRHRTADVVTSETKSTGFRSLPLSDAVKEGLGLAGYTHPTPIQLKAIPIGLLGVDMVVKSKAGTGKTLIFAVLALEAVDTKSALPQSITITSTREIALQIASVIEKVGSNTPGLACHTFIGGTALREDKTKLKKCHIAVGSPGRINGLIEQSLLFTSMHTHPPPLLPLQDFFLFLVAIIARNTLRIHGSHQDQDSLGYSSSW